MNSTTAATNVVLTRATLAPDVPQSLITAGAVIIIIVACIGILGNTLVIAAVFLHKKLRSVHNVFVVNLAVADLVVNIFIEPFLIVGSLDRGPFFYKHYSLCEAIAAMVVISCVTSIFSIASIAVERYVFICHNAKHGTLYNKITLPFIVGGVWLYALLVDLPNFKFIGWGGHSFNPEILACAFDYAKANESGYNYFIFVFGFLIAVIALFFCYIRIYVFVRKSRTRMQAHYARNSGISLASNTSNSAANLCTTGTEIEMADKQVLKVTAVILAVFCLMWSPFMIVTSLSTWVTFPNWLYFVSGVMCVSNSSINFMIYALNEEFRVGYALVKTRMLHHCKKVNVLSLVNKRR